MIQALKSGILILLFPPLFICGGIMFLAYRKRDLFNDAPNEVPTRLGAPQ